MTRDWWKQTVFYQIYPRSFSDSNGDGIGDIPGIISKLDYLQDLGIGAIWLSPVYKSPNHDNGYDISDYYDINPEYGTLDDMKQLFIETKRRDIRIIMDLVINHTSDEHPWFVEAGKPGSPYRGYYIWADAKQKGNRRRPPNNWLSYFGGPAWQWHKKSGQYYLHLFSSHQPDLNFNNPVVIEEVKKIMRFWLDMGAAGFRCDVINMIYKTSLADGSYSLFHLPGSEHYFSQAGNHDILHELRWDILEPYGAFAVGESGGVVDIPTAQQFIGGELDALFVLDHLNVDTFGMPFLKRKYRPERLKRVLSKWQSALAWNALFFENHDTERSVSKFGASGEQQTHSATMLATLLLTLKGSPFIYQGQEIGMENYPFRAIDEVQDESTRSIYRFLRRRKLPHWLAFRLAMMVCRDHARVPMQWDASKNAGFTTGTPWRPVHPDYEKVNVAAGKDDEDSTYNFYRALVRLRNGTPALQQGSVEILPAHDDVFAYRRQLDSTRYTVVANMGPKRRHYELPAGELVLSNYSAADMSSHSLQPYQTVVIRESA